MLNGTFHSLPIAEIVVLRDERQRTHIEIEDLQKSISRVGLINPIVVKLDEQGRHVLVAGERRLKACTALQWENIPVQFAHELTQAQSSIIELEENIKRRDLPWQDLVVAVANLHDLYSEDEANEGKWSQAATAKAISITEGTISVYLKVHKFINDDRIRRCATVRQAYDVIDRRESRQVEAAFAQLLEGDVDEDDEADALFDDGEGLEPPKPLTREQVLTAQEQDLAEAGMVKINGIWTADPNRPVLTPIVIEFKPKRNGQAANLAETIVHTSFLDWAPSYSGPRFNFVHCDFPYGATEVGPQMQGNEHRIYEDSPEIYMKLLDCFVDNLDRFFSVSGWIMFWYSERLGKETRDVFKFKAPSLEVQTHPLIWLHSDNSGISPEHKYRPRHIYDTCLLMRRGDMPLVRLKSDAHASPSSREIHPSTKPEAMLRYFFEMFVDDQTSLLDPTCGGGSAIRAAESLGAKKALGLEVDWQYAEAARVALKDHRAKMSIIRGV
jgi:ParB family chromosome partitioning protein